LCKGIGTVIDKDEIRKWKERNDRSRLYANRGGKHYRKKDYLVLMDTTISNAQAAKRLGKSVKAVESARYRLRKEAKLNEQGKTAEGTETAEIDAGITCP
jgi:hypothetical protein